MDLTKISGIGEVRKKSFEEMGIFSCENLIDTFPSKYYDFSKTSLFDEDGKVKLIKATVIDSAKIFRARAGLSFVTCKVCDEAGHNFNAVWYNQTYIKSQLFLGEEIYLFGKNNASKKNTFIVQISKKCEKLKLGLLPVYRTGGKIGQMIMSNSIELAISTLEINSLIPQKLQEKYNLMSLKPAYESVHFPKSFEEAQIAKDRIEIEKLIPLIAFADYQKSIYRTKKPQKYGNSAQIFDEYQRLLPFVLTPQQKNAIFEIEKDMLSNFSMNRLLQGDVGSGKTAIALYFAFLAAKNGHQAAFIAPTEILASQHYQTAKKLFEKTGINVAIITSNISKLERAAIIDGIKSNKIQIVIGTHSILSDEIEFSDLTFITIDEQHRFGVEQRKILKNKGFAPDVLVMSATPIPRSLSLVIYGDLDISTLSARPTKSNIQTSLISSKEEQMWDYIGSKTQQGSKAYVVCAKIDECLDDDDQIEYSASSMFKKLKAKFGDKVGLLHGKQTKDSQNKTLNDFKSGKISILVSTTVVEVGVDVPDADIIVIATPERFGLATLHQLRGRVGRQGQESYCFCICNNLTEKSLERLTFFKNNNDGFKIAEFDMKVRGSGSIVGTNQHGKNFGIGFSSINYSRAKEILEQMTSDVALYSKVLEKGNELFCSSLLSKIILN